MRNRVGKPILSARVLALVGALLGTGLVACQSAPVASKEPPAREAAPATGTTAGQAALQGAAPAEPTQPAVVKLTGSSPEGSSLAAAPPPVSAQPVPAAAPPQNAATKPAPSAASPLADKGASEKGAGDKSAEAKAPAGKTVQGAVVNEEPFSTWLQVTSPAKAGAPLQLEAVLVAKPPYHCNAEYPHKFKLSAAPAGLSYPEETVRGMKVAPERSVLSIPVNAQSAGKPTVTGTLSFSVCTEERCLVEKRELSVALDVM